MTNVTVKVYCEELDVPSEVKPYLLACYRNHLAIYNDMVDLHRKEKFETSKEMKAALSKMLAKEEFLPVLKQPLNREIYYMFKRGSPKHKLITDIQYISVMADGAFKNSIFLYDRKENTISVIGSKAPIVLRKELPVTEGCDSYYINISYSCGRDIFELAVFATLPA